MPSMAHIIGVDDVDVEVAIELGILVIHALPRSVLHAPRGEVPDYVYNTEVIARWQSHFGTESVWSVPSESVPLPARYTNMRERPWHSIECASAWWARMGGRTDGAPAPTSQPSPRWKKPNWSLCARRTRRPPSGRSNALGLGWRSGTIRR